ncbi:Peptide-transporting ATPase [Bertholletia excelsa]
MEEGHMESTHSMGLNAGTVAEIVNMHITCISLCAWIQGNIGWGLGLGLPDLFMSIAIMSSSFVYSTGSPLTWTTDSGSHLCSFRLTAVALVTRKGGNGGWIWDNLNEGHLDYLF